MPRSGIEGAETLCGCIAREICRAAMAACGRHRVRRTKGCVVWEGTARGLECWELASTVHRQGSPGCSRWTLHYILLAFLPLVPPILIGVLSVTRTRLSFTSAPTAVVIAVMTLVVADRLL